MPEPEPRSRRRPERACRDKIRYPDARRAGQAAARQAEHFGTPFDAYACPHCDGWHTGNTPRWLQLDREYGVFAGQEPAFTHQR